MKEGRKVAKFSLTDLLNDSSKEGSSKSTFKIRNINIDKIIPDSRNFYTVNDVTELKESIFIVGLQQNLLVRENPGKDTFSLISGHRRLKALQELVREGYREFETAPCKVETDIDEIKAELQLIFANATSRELSDYEKTRQAVRIKELLALLKESGVKLTGRMRELVADTLKVSPAQVGRMESIEGKLVSEFKEEFKKGQVNFSTAYELSGLPTDKQQEVFREYKDKGTLSINDVKAKKTDNRQIQQGEKNVKERTELTEKPIGEKLRKDSTAITKLNNLERLLDNMKILLKAGILDAGFKAIAAANPNLDSISKLNEMIEKEVDGLAKTLNHHRC